MNGHSKLIEQDYFEMLEHVFENAPTTWEKCLHSSSRCYMELQYYIFLRGNIKSGGMKCPVTFIENINIMFLPLSPDVNLPTCHFPFTHNTLRFLWMHETPVSSALYTLDAGKLYFSVNSVNILKKRSTWGLLKPTALIRLVDCGVLKTISGCLFLNPLKKSLPAILFSLLNRCSIFKSSAKSYTSLKIQT